MFSVKTPNITVRIAENFSVYAMLNVAKKFWGPSPQLWNKQGNWIVSLNFLDCGRIEK